MEQQSSNTAHPAVGRPSVGRLRSARSMSTPPPPRPPRGVILDASAVAREPAKRKPAFGGTAGAKASHWRHSYTADREPSEGSQASAFDPSKAVLPTNRADKVFAYTMEGCKVGLAGFMQQDLGFPATFGVGAALSCPALHWVREATAEEIAAGDYEKRVGDNCFKKLGWQPKGMVHSNGGLAFAHESIGIYGSHVGGP